jgi:protein TonB
VQGDRYEEAVIIKRVAPVYPAAAHDANISGQVTVSVQIDEKGNVRSAKALDGPLALRQSAENAAKQWKFNPARKNGLPVPETQRIQFVFQR